MTPPIWLSHIDGPYRWPSRWQRILGRLFRWLKGR